jgi:hypothetical protein
MAEELKKTIKEMTIGTPIERIGLQCCRMVDAITEQHKEDTVKQSVLFVDVMIYVSEEVIKYKTQQRKLYSARQQSVMLNRNRPFALKR